MDSAKRNAYRKTLAVKTEINVNHDQLKIRVSYVQFSITEEHFWMDVICGPTTEGWTGNKSLMWVPPLMIINEGH